MTQPTTVPTLPGIPFADLPENTKDFLLATSLADGKPAAEVIIETLDAAARDAGFDPEKAAA